MPESFTDNEREYIKKRLMEQVSLCLTQFGVRKTTADELVKRVNIPKWTFYLFYQSKELLFFDVFFDFHDAVQASLMSEITTKKEEMNAQRLTELFYVFNTGYYNFTVMDVAAI